MKNRKIIRLFSIMFILTLLLATLSVLPASATTTYSLTLSPTQGKIGDTISVRGTMSPASSPSQVHTANVYISPTNIAVGANLSASSLYYMRVRAGLGILTTADGEEAGNFTTSFVIPTTLTVSTEPLAGGTVSHTVAAGTYYVYFTVSYSATPSSVWIVAGKATLTVTAPALDPLSPTSGPAGTDVVVSGSNFPASTSLVFKYDTTTTLTPTSGHTATTTGGLFLTHIAIPSGATAGAHTISVTAGTATVSATFTVTTTTTTPPTSTPTLDPLSPTSGAAGSTVTISGFNFPASITLVFKFDTTTVTPSAGSTSTSAGGSFTSLITVPSSATVGGHIITVSVGSVELTATFTVTTTTTTPPPTGTPLTLDYTSGPVGSTINIHGSGFIPSHAFTVSYNNGDGTSTNITGTVGVDGFFFASLEIPPSQHGVHTITATDGTNTASADFTVESATPTVPQPLRPYMNEAVSSPVTFDWADVEDASLPVTYNLQIATDTSFATDSIMINKTGIATSTYILTDADLAKLSVGPIYYWREKAVDGALNESAWTGANAFSLSQAFSFTGWPLYLTIGIGAFLLFLLGIWLGRRTAYNY